MKTKDIGLFVHNRIMARMAEGDSQDYWTVYHQILAEDPDLRAIYANLQTKVIIGPQISPEQQSAQAAGGELHRRTKEFMKQMNLSDDKCEWCLKQVCKCNPDLVRKYQV